MEPVCNVPFGKSTLVCRLLKGLFDIRPSLPRYVTIWDVARVFTFINSKSTLTDYDLKTVSHRLAILFSLRAGQKDQTIKRLKFGLHKGF